MDNVIFAGIDGTNSAQWRRKSDGLNSHVCRFYRDCSAQADQKKYWDGPDTFGLAMPGLVDEVTTWVLRTASERIRQGLRQEDIQICLVGHSRGAVAAIAVAERLSNFRQVGALVPPNAAKCPVRVRFLGLYDAVDLSMVSPDLSLKNVDAVAHAVRENRDWFVGTRGWFGTVRVSGSAPRLYNTAHGGIGGDPGFFTDLSSLTDDMYSNALQLVLSDAELLRKYGTIGLYGPNGYVLTTEPRFKQLTGTAQTRRIGQLLEHWAESWAADEFIRREAKTSCRAAIFNHTSPHRPWLEKDFHLALKLAQILGKATLSRL